MRKIAEVSEEILIKDLEKYRNIAIQLGATDAKVVTKDYIIFDERVRAKCIIPKCPYYGTNAQCPPYAISVELAKEVISRYNYGIFVMMRSPMEELLDNTKADRTGIKLYEIVSEIESAAFYDGYYLALGLATGPCKKFFCPQTDCALLLPGGKCRHPLKARPSMEGVCLDAYKMATKIGWDIYPIGTRTKPSDVPYGTRLGIVLIH
ncbi:MAG: DUF2284 domain-containing protein [Candidatus Bathyarchaeia archaeon]